MTVHVASNLDTVKFRKVHTLMTRGATDGERSSARERAKKLAAKAGLSLQEAVSRLDRPDPPAPPPKAKSFFEEMEDAMEAANPGHKAERAAWEAERQRERDGLQKEALQEFGTEDEVWAETKQERLLRETLEPLADWGRYANAGCNPGGLYIKGYAGWTCQEPTPPLWNALAKAYPFPVDLVGVWSELREWSRLTDLRCAFLKDHSPPVHVQAREAALGHLMDTMPGPTFGGVGARIEWMEALNERGWSRDQEEDAALISALKADFDTLRKSAGQPDQVPEPPSVQTGHRTTAEKRAAVLSMLSAHPELSDREIARRVGVSPQTVNTWRRKSS